MSTHDDSHIINIQLTNKGREAFDVGELSPDMKAVFEQLLESETSRKLDKP